MFAVVTLTLALSRRWRGDAPLGRPVAMWVRVAAAAAVMVMGLAACGGGPGPRPEGRAGRQQEASQEYQGDSQELGELVRAVGDFDEAIKLNPENPTLYLQRGATLAELLDLNRAVEDFSQAIRLDPTDPPGLPDEGRRLR